MLPAFNVLLLWGLIRSVLATTGPLFRGVGRPSIATRVQAAQLVILAIVIYPLTARYGVVGAAWATVAAAVVPDVIAVIAASRVSTASLGAVGRVISFPVGHSLLMLAILLALEPFVSGGAWLLMWAPLVGASVYLGAILVSRRWFGYLKGGLLPASS
jgi:PST family polysaccharide transporter/lipopolysaccharide exporter